MRAPRIVLPDFPHHVVTRGNNRRTLFSSTSDYEMFLYFLAKDIELSGCQLHGLSLMKNHVHLIVTPHDDDGLATLMKASQQRYTQVRNKKKSASGKLFERGASEGLPRDGRLVRRGSANVRRGGGGRGDRAAVGRALHAVAAAA